MNPNEIFLNGIRKGMTVESASALAGVNYELTIAILKRGKREAERIGSTGKALKVRKAEEHHLAAWKSFTKARADLEMSLLGSIITSENYKAQQWLLEKVNPFNYGGGEGLDEFDAS